MALPGLSGDWTVVPRSHGSRVPVPFWVVGFANKRGTTTQRLKPTCTAVRNYFSLKPQNGDMVGFFGSHWIPVAHPLPAHLACVGRAVLKIPIYTWCGHEMPRMNKGILGFRKLDLYFCCPFDHVFGGRLFWTRDRWPMAQFLKKTSGARRIFWKQARIAIDSIDRQNLKPLKCVWSAKTDDKVCWF